MLQKDDAGKEEVLVEFSVHELKKLLKTPESF
jgi:hypothetical protein